MITLHESNITSFPLDNGIGVLSDAIKAYAEEELNGLLEFEMEYDSEGLLVDELKTERIIKAKAQDKLGYQLFRIYAITKNHENDNYSVKAQHITYDLANNFVEKLTASNLTKKQVMEKIGSSTVLPHPFNITSSNNSTQSSTELYRTNPLQMIAGMDGSVLQIWGGQIERDNFDIIMHDRRGHDDGVTVTYEKNITGLTAEFDISGVVTRIFPFVLIEATEDKPERLITVTGKYIDSEYIDDYDKVYIEPVDYSSDERIDKQDKTDAQIRTQLTSVASQYFTETNNDKPKATLEVGFEHLWETEEYKGVAPLELVGMGDGVAINHSKLKVEATAIVNYIRYDCIAEVNEEVKLGNVKARFTDSLNKIDNLEKKVEEVETNANRAITAANGKNTIFYGPDEPTSGMILNDTWFEQIDNQFIRTWRFDGIEWQLQIDLASYEAQAQADIAANNATQALLDAEEAFNKAKANATLIDDLSLVIGTVEEGTTIVGTIEGLQTEVNKKVDETTYTSAITQLGKDINARVEKDDVINQINISDENILISGSKLILDGNTTVNGDFKLDGSANIKDASIGTAQIGTIDAAIASIINLSANNIAGGILTSLNSNTTFNLNNGSINMENANLTIGGGSAGIRFTSRYNSMYYDKNGIKAGVGFDVGSSGNPITYYGSSFSTFTTNDFSWAGLIISSQASQTDGSHSSIIGKRFKIRDRTDYARSFHFEVYGSRPYLAPENTGNYDYDLGSDDNAFDRMYLKSRIYASGDFRILNRNSKDMGWYIETAPSGNGDARSIRGFNTGLYNYQIGSSRVPSRILNIYLSNAPNVSSDERLKDILGELDLGLDFILKINPIKYRLKPTTADKNQGIIQNKVQYGVSAQQVLSILSDYGIVDQSLITGSEEEFYGAAYEQFTGPIINSIKELYNDLDIFKGIVEDLQLKIAKMESAA